MPKIGRMILPSLMSVLTMKLTASTGMAKPIPALAPEGEYTAIYSPSGASAGIGFAIPVDAVNFIVNTLIKDGKIIRPILGIGYLESKQARALGISRGVLVLDVPLDSPAAKAGLKGTHRTETGLIEIGDIIVKVGDTVINTEANLFEALEGYQPGDNVEV